MPKPSRSRRVRSFVILLLLGIPAFAAYLHWPQPPLQMCRAVDGDTIRCGDQRVRLAGLDAPELRGRCDEERHLAQVATERLRVLIVNGVTLRPAGRDRYDRLLAVVLDSSGNDVAYTLIREGLAHEYHGRGRRAGWC
ncbi:MAG: thermonuclease family protein [Roseococcus sp.]